MDKSEYQKEYYQKNKDRLNMLAREKYKIDYPKNKLKYSLKCKKYYEKNKIKIKKKVSEYKQKNKKIINIKKAIYQKKRLKKDIKFKKYTQMIRKITSYKKNNPNLFPKECIICHSNENIEFHHPCYDFEYSVYPLCRLRHQKIHENLRFISRGVY